MKSTMMQFQLTITPILERAGSLFPDVEIVSRMPDGSIHRQKYRDFYRRARALAAALQAAGLRSGDRVATLMWNHYVHLEAYFGIPAVGGVLHTLNLRLHPDELVYIVNHAQDRFLIVDDILLGLFEQIRDHVKFDRVFVVSLTHNKVPDCYDSYESVLDQSNGEPNYPVLDENDAAGICYTSGTTGRPKGVSYSHRALVLHSFSISLPDNFAIGRKDCVLTTMSMFHANGWGLPYAATMNGAKHVFPGPSTQPEVLLELMETEQVTLTGGVPTIWLGVLEALERQPKRWKLASDLRIVVAGSAAPESIFWRFAKFGMRVIHAWGLSETTPIATVSTLKKKMESWSDDQKYQIRATQGLPSPFVEIRTVGDTGETPRDGKSPGELQVRGPWIAASYFNLPAEQDKWTEDGWFRTGDVGTIDVEGYIKITDRIKDLIKSGGEWISSVDVENALVGHTAVKEAAVVAVPHPKWRERPLAIVVLRHDAQATPADLRAFLAAKFAKWQIPDAFVFVEELPHTSTGKLLKSQLREQFANWEWNVNSC